ncbi:nuclear factor NF-kappa-B p100 subunit isoform X3 [Dermacentor andersoni]|uniref:nuclear factor NF-kappa-B p100 subunit isoform X3 n=1 Tax=Dermacentor andersoni TaxID=34620 RepID=UPI002417D09A|nr:nuclear factor NF-kappa-B p100 subunit-like isoform X3 [Dermacentor andersoni]
MSLLVDYGWISSSFCEAAAMDDWSYYEDDPYSTPLGNVAYPVSGEEVAAASSSSAEQEQLRSFQDLLLRSFQPNQPQHQNIGMPICTNYEEQSLHMAGGVRLVILEQPMKETRYRYKSESGSHGPLIGESSTQQRKTYPTVKLENYNTQLPHRIKASLVTAEDTARPHVHRITMRGRDDEDCCFVTVRENGTAMFPSMSIVFQQKKTVADILYRRKIESLQPSQEEQRQLQTEAKREAAELNLNLVRICFTAECCEEGVWKPLCVAYSNPVANSKAGKLRITKVNRNSGSCKGGDEVWILCEKINKKDIQIKFFEENEETKERTWEAAATFQESDVHYQVAIVFKTPPYRNTNLQHQVAVKFQLIRKSDNDCSEPFEFTYLPCGPSEELLARKRRKLSHHSPEEMSPYSGIMAPPSSSSSTGGQAFPNEFGMATSYPGTSAPLNAVLAPGFEPQSSCTQGGYSTSTPLLHQVSTPTLESIVMATDGNGLEASMGRLSLGGEGNRNETEPGFQHSSMACPCGSSKEAVIKVEDESAHSSGHDSFDGSVSVCTSKTSNRLGTAMYAVMCWMTKELMSKCSTKTLTRLVAEMIPISDLHGNNALHLAVRHSPHLLTLLLKMLANTKCCACINKQNDGGQTPLHVAAQSGRHDLVMILLVGSADLSLVDRLGQTALHCGVLGSLPLRVLRAMLSQPQLQPNAADKQGKTALHLAVEKRDSAALETLCRAGLNVNAAVEGTGDRPLHLAVRGDFVEGINILIKQKTIQVAAINSCGIDALNLALDMKREAIVEILCSHRESQPGGRDSEIFSTNARTEPERVEGGNAASLRSRVVEVLESEENAARVLKLLEDGKDTVVEKMIALLKASGLGNTIYRKYLQEHDDDALRRLFVDVLEISLN